MSNLRKQDIATRSIYEEKVKKEHNGDKGFRKETGIKLLKSLSDRSNKDIMTFKNTCLVVAADTMIKTLRITKAKKMTKESRIRQSNLSNG